MKNREELKELLDELHDKYNRVEFIENDPISIPHSFEGAEDREISGFLASTIAWGNRKAIVTSARRMMDYLDDQPYSFVMNASPEELRGLERYVHRTFNGGDFVTYIRALRAFYQTYGSLGAYFQGEYARSGDIRVVMSAFRSSFFDVPHEKRTQKHLSSIDKGAACKRLNMYLRWMVRSDDRGVDFGLWSGIPSSALYLPLDVHTANMGRALGLLDRNQNDWKAVEQITSVLREMDSSDPTKYDFALFGAGIDGFLK